MLQEYKLMILFLSLWFLAGCGTSQPSPAKRTLEVTATAYTSSKQETDRTPFLAAWKNRLKPGIKSIAISRDLLALGLTNGCEVTIDGLEGTYKVLDKMHKRWKKKIDIYMGVDRKKALRWGKQRVTIRWAEKDSSIPDTNQSISLLALIEDRPSG